MGLGKLSQARPEGECLPDPLGRRKGEVAQDLLPFCGKGTLRRTLRQERERERPDGFIAVRFLGAHELEDTRGALSQHLRREEQARLPPRIQDNVSSSPHATPKSGEARW